MCESLKKAYYNLYMSKTCFCFGPIHLHPQINTHIDINPQKKLIHCPFGVEWLDHLYISWESLLLPIVMLGYFSGRNRQRGIKLFSHNLCTNKLRGKKFFVCFCTRISYVVLAQYASAECSFLEFYDYRYKICQIIHFNFLRYFSNNQYPRNQKDVYLS